MRLAALVGLLAAVTPNLPGPAPTGVAPLAVTVRARALEPGELAVLTVTTAAPADRLTVKAFDRDQAPFPVDRTHWRCLVGLDLEIAPGAYPVTIESGSARLVYRLQIIPKQFPTRRLSVDEAFVNPPEAVLARIADEAKTLAALWTHSAPGRLWDGPFVRPVPQPANSAFGSRSIFNGQPRAPHSGADFLSPAGTPVAAPNGGTVVLARDLYYTGNTIVLDHGLGLFSLFAHLSAMNVAEGDHVRSGQLLGKVGATGRVTGPHLHWMVRATGARVDPLSLLATLGPTHGGE